MTTRPILPLFQLVSLREITYLSCHPLLRAAGLSLYNFSSRRVKHTWLSWLLGLWPNFIGTLLKVMKLGKEWQKSEKCGSTAFLDDFSVMNFGDEFWWGFDLVTWPYSNHFATERPNKLCILMWGVWGWVLKKVVHRGHGQGICVRGMWRIHRQHFMWKGLKGTSMQFWSWMLGWIAV